MTGARIIVGAVLLGLFSLMAGAQAGPPRAPQAKGRRPMPPRARRAGDWIRAHSKLPPAEQEKALENDPEFKKQSPERQAELRRRLRYFNSLPPRQRERALRRWEILETYSPEQREQIRQAQQELRSLPELRRLMIHRAVRALHRMTPEGRQQVYQSDRFHNTFSQQEQNILKRLTGMTPPEEPPAKEK